MMTADFLCERCGKPIDEQRARHALSLNRKPKACSKACGSVLTSRRSNELKRVSHSTGISVATLQWATAIATAMIERQALHIDREAYEAFQEQSRRYVQKGAMRGRRTALNLL